MKVGVLTAFDSWNEAYSLTSVVEAQLRALVKYGYEPVFYCLDIFKDDAKVPEGVEVRKIIPQILLVDYSSEHVELTDSFESDVNKIYEAFKEHTKDVDIIMQHDLIFQGWFLPHAVAIHKLAAESKIKWFHWMHSAPSGRPAEMKKPYSLRFILPQNSKLVYLNNKHLINAAEMYGIFPKDVRVVHNSVDPRVFWNTHPLIGKLIDKYDILSAEYLDIYPFSTTRMDAKGVSMVIDIMAGLKKLGKKVCVVFCNAHANDKREKQEIAKKMSYANQKGLSSSEVIFTSLEGEEYEQGVPREVVSQLFLLSNIFIFPSMSENCSLVLLEAMLSKNLLVLNDNGWLPFREFAQDNALYFDFGSFRNKMEYDDRDKWTTDVARIVDSEVRVNRALRAQSIIKKSFSYDSIFKEQIEPLFTENDNN